MADAIAVEFMGGGLHGQHRAVPTGADGLPTAVHIVSAARVMPSGDMELYALVYRRQPSALSDGPLWVYVCDEPDAFLPDVSDG